MAYISQDEKKQIAPAIKELLKKHGLKGTLSIENHSTIVLTVKSGRLDFFQNYKNPQGHSAREYLNPNQYWLDNSFSGECLDFLKKAFVLLKGKDWFDDSDSMTDYFHTKHYLDIKIGRWDKPYVLEA